MKVIITNTKTGQGMGRMSLNEPLGWVDIAFAATFADTESALSAATMAFGHKTALIDCQPAHI